MQPRPDQSLSPQSWRTTTYAELRRDGLSRRRIDGLVRDGALIRVRKGTYVSYECPNAALAAARHGARLDCVSLLSVWGVFVLEGRDLHLQMDYGSTRVGPRRTGVVRHWRTTSADDDDLAGDVIEALAQACRCQPPRAAIATLDSAWHHGVVDGEGIAAVFDLLPRRFGVLRSLLDPRCESGPESLLRLLLRSCGWAFDVQVSIDGVGRVDFVVEGWLILECDSRAFHEGWEAQRRDRRRDLAAGALGYTTLRPLAEDIMYHPEVVVAAIRGLITARAATAARTTTPNR